MSNITHIMNLNSWMQEAKNPTGMAKTSTTMARAIETLVKAGIPVVKGAVEQVVDGDIRYATFSVEFRLHGLAVTLSSSMEGEESVFVEGDLPQASFPFPEEAVSFLRWVKPEELTDLDSFYEKLEAAGQQAWQKLRDAKTLAKILGLAEGIAPHALAQKVDQRQMALLHEKGGYPTLKGFVYMTDPGCGGYVGDETIHMGRKARVIGRSFADNYINNCVDVCFVQIEWTEEVAND